MALPASGAISLANVNTELGVASNTTRSLNDAAVRSLFGKASGVISMSDGYGKSSTWRATISTHQAYLNLRSWAISNGWNGSAAAEITIASGIYVYSDNVATPALTMDSFPGGLTLIVNGYIMGKGGNGGSFYTRPENPAVAYAPEAGGVALALGGNIVINATNGYIAGGGGGGGGGNGAWSFSGGGGGAGGGAGGGVTDASGYSSAGGGGGGLGGAGGNGAGNSAAEYSGGGGGGRVLPGAGASGISSLGSAYGVGGYGGGAGGSGGAAGATSSSKVPGAVAGGGGGGWGAAGGAAWFASAMFSGYSGAGGSANGAGGDAFLASGGVSQAGAAGGKAIATNGYAITWASGTTHIYGIVG